MDLDMQYVKAVALKEVTINDVYRGAVPLIVLQLIGLVLCIIFPQIILCFPDFW